MKPDTKQPYVRFFVSDWLGATRGMKANEIGIYITLLMLMYERQEPIPENSERLARQCGCTPKTLQPVLDMLIDDGKIRRVEGGLWNGRVEKEFEFRRKNSEGNSEAAKKRWQKPNENNVGVMHTHSDRTADAMHIPEAICKEKTDANASAKKPKPEARATRLPADWKLPDEFRQYALDAGLFPAVVEGEALKFRDWSLSSPNGAKRDWAATWRNWVRSVIERQPKVSQPQPTTKRRASEILADMARNGDHNDQQFTAIGGAVIDASDLFS